jgi:hypothetical protein
MLKENNMPHSFWREAVKIVWYVLNNTSISFTISIKVFDPGGNFCNSSPSFLLSYVCIPHISVSIFVFDSNGNQLCSLLLLFRGGGSAFVFDPGGTNSFRFSLFPSTVFVVAFHLFSLT